jgi:REP element-mobilizing transposase RayT
MDKLLDFARTGPRWLALESIAGIVVNAICKGEQLEHYEAHAWVVMPNHVHLLVTSQLPARRWLGSLKGYTGHAINRALERKGTVWQDESYDHLVRSTGGFSRVQRYIEQNPVRAGLVQSPEEFPWSSAAHRRGGSPKGLTPQRL